MFGRSKIIITIKIIIAATFLFSAISKILAPGYFEITLIDQGLFSDRNTAAYIARIFIVIELSLGLLFFQSNYIRKIIAPTAMLLLIAFIIHMSILMIGGDNENCGCFSSVISMNPIEAIIKNIILLVLVIYVYKYSKREFNKLVLPLGIIVVSILIVVIFTPIKRTDKFPFAKYTHFVNYGRVDLTEGEFLIPIFDASCEHCMQAAKSMKRISSEIDNFPEIFTLIFSESKSEINDFQDRTETDFPYRQVNVDEFFDLIGSAPPRIYWLLNGEIKNVWDDNIEKNLWDTFSKNDQKYIELNVE